MLANMSQAGLRPGTAARADLVRFSRLEQAGANVQAFQRTVNAVRVIRRNQRYLLITQGPAPTILFSTEKRSIIDWLDFTIELIAGLIAMMLGVSLGKRGYQALRPAIRTLWQDTGFRRRIELVGHHTLSQDSLATGLAVIELWRYIWREHRSTLLKSILGAIGSVIGPRALALAMIRWLARLISGGTVLAVEIGALVLPLGRKLRLTSEEASP